MASVTFVSVVHPSYAALAVKLKSAGIPNCIVLPKVLETFACTLAMAALTAVNVLLITIISYSWLAELLNNTVTLERILLIAGNALASTKLSVPVPFVLII